MRKGIGLHKFRNIKLNKGDVIRTDSGAMYKIANFWLTENGSPGSELVCMIHATGPKRSSILATCEKFMSVLGLNYEKVDMYGKKEKHAGKSKNRNSRKK